MTVDIRFAVNVSPKPGILDPQGRAVEGSLDHLGIDGVSAVRLASELLSNPLIEAYEVEVLGAASSIESTTAGARA